MTGIGQDVGTLEPCAFLVGRSNDTATEENRTAAPQKSKRMITE